MDLPSFPNVDLFSAGDFSEGDEKDEIVLRDPASVTSHKRNAIAEAGLLNITTDQVLKAARELLAAESGGTHA